MIALEAAMLTLLLVLLGLSTYTDSREGYIYNRHLKYGALGAILLDAAYYGTVGNAFSMPALFNFAILATIGGARYGFHIWAGGDTKLLLIIGLCIPGRIYLLQPHSIGAGAIVVAVAFLTAFLWAILRGIYLGWKNKNLLQMQRRVFPYRRMIVSCLMMIGIIQTIDLALHPQFFQKMQSEPLLFLSCYCLMVFGMMNLRARLSTTAMTSIAAILWCICAWLMVSNHLGLVFNLKWRLTIYTLVIALMALRLMLEKYGYERIPTASVSTGQILSAATVMQFAKSRVQGLPTVMTEDLRARLTPAEAESVRRWEKSKYGKPEVVVVKKIPFAIFLAIGVVAFFLYEVLGK